VGTYYFNTGLDLGDVYTSRVVPTLQASGEDVSDVMSVWTSLSAVPYLSVVSPSDWSVVISVAITDNAPWYSDSNLLLFPIDFDNAGWTKTNASVSANSTRAPDGTVTADTLVEDSTADAEHSVYDDHITNPDVQQVFSVWAKSAGRNIIRLSLSDAASATDYVSAVFSLTSGTAGTVTNGGNGTNAAASIVDYGGGWFKCIVSGIPNTSGADTRAKIEMGSGDLTWGDTTVISWGDGTTATAGNFPYSGDGASGVYLWGAELLTGTTANTPTWTAWEEIIIGDYTCRAFKFKAELESLNDNTAPLISSLGAVIDMPDREERGADLQTSAGGVYTVTYANAFKAAPTVKITGQDMATGDYFTVTSKSTTGFTVNFFNSAAAGVQRTFDFSASGYGRLLV